MAQPYVVRYSIALCAFMNITQCSVATNPSITPFTPMPPVDLTSLLEALEERQVTIGGQDMKLPDPFIAFATQTGSYQN